MAAFVLSGVVSSSEDESAWFDWSSGEKAGCTPGEGGLESTS